MMDTQEIFDNTLEELKQRTESNKEYHLLMTTPLLRKLLIDGDNSLVCQIDKKNKKLRFKVNMRESLHKRVPSVFTTTDLQTYSWFAKDGFDPETANKNSPSYNVQEISYDAFLQQVVVYAKGKEISVRDLIKHLSDKEGGVHKQRKELDESEIKNWIIRDLGDTIEIGNIPAILSTLGAINRIVIRSLEVFKS